MSSLAPVVTYAPLTQGPTIDRLTITLWLQLAFSAGYYTVGGVPSGLAAFAGTQTIDSAPFLASRIDSEATTSSSPAVAGYTYKYIPSTDKIQIFLNGSELTASQAIPANVLNDIIVGQFIWVRL